MRLNVALFIVLMMMCRGVCNAQSQAMDPCEMTERYLKDTGYKSIKEYKDYRCPEGYAKKDNEYCPSITPWCEEIPLLGFQYYDRYKIFGGTLRASVSNKTMHVYQLAWLSSFNGDVFMRLEINDQKTGQLFVKKIVEDGSGSSGATKLDIQGELDANQVKRFLETVDKNDFWTLPTTDSRQGWDGAYWMMEGLKDGNYHLLERWSPDDHDKMKTIFLFLFALGEDLVRDKTGGESTLSERGAY